MTTQVNSAAPFALKKYSVALTALSIRQPTDLTRICGEAPTQAKAESIVKQQSSPGLPGIIVRDLEKKKTGDRVTIEAYDVLGGEPIMGDQMREGRGEDVDIASMEAKIDLASKVINAKPGTMIDQRTSIELDSMAMAQLKAYFPRLLWNRTQVHIAGARGSQRSKAWHVPLQSAQSFNSVMINPVLAPSYNRHLVIDTSAGGIVQGGQQLGSIDSTDGWKLSVIDQIAEYLDSIEFKMQPIRLPDDPAAYDSPIRGVLYMDPQAHNQLITDNSSTHNIRTWQAQAMERAKYLGKGHPLFNGEVYMWNGILIRKMEHSIYFNPGESTNIVTAANRYANASGGLTETAQTVNAGLTAGYRVTRSILLGAQAFGVLMGVNSSSGFTAAYKTRLYDYDSKKESMGEWMGGETKLRLGFRNVDGQVEPTDHGALVIDAAVRAVGA